MGDYSGGAENSTSSSLGLLDAEHVDLFRHALQRILAAEIAETTFSEIIDGLPTRASWLKFDLWNEKHPVNVLKHETLCDGAREKARRFRDEFDIYMLTFPPSILQDFQKAGRETKEYFLSLIELLARSCHQIAARLFQLDDGFHKHSIYEGWRDAPIGPQSNPWRVAPSPSAFCHRCYVFHEQYPQGIADVVGYWAEARIFGGVVVFDRGPSGAERREMYLHAGDQQSPLTLFPPTPDQFKSLVQFLQPGSGPCPLPIEASRLNGYRYHPDDAISRFNIFRDRYERKEPPIRSTHHSWNNSGNWPEMWYALELVALQEKRAQGIEIDEAEWTAAEEGIRRITPSSPDWPPLSFWRDGS